MSEYMDRDLLFLTHLLIVFLLIIAVFGGVDIVELISHKDIDKDGQIGYKWTEDVVKSKGLVAGKTYYGIIYPCGTNKKIHGIITLKDDYSFDSMWTDECFPLQGTSTGNDSIGGTWDYYKINNTIYRLLRFESPFVYKVNWMCGCVLCVDENLRIYSFNSIQENNSAESEVIGYFK